MRETSRVMDKKLRCSWWSWCAALPLGASCSPATLVREIQPFNWPTSFSSPQLSGHSLARVGISAPNSHCSKRTKINRPFLLLPNCTTARPASLCQRRDCPLPQVAGIGRGRSENSHLSLPSGSGSAKCHNSNEWSIWKRPAA